MKDLQPSFFVLHTKIFLAVVLGGVISLAVCGQFGMGMTSWAEVFSHKLHENMPLLACSLICGTIFAIFPTFILRVLLCSPMQFRVILSRRIFDLALWYGVAGISLASYGHHGQGTLELITWFVASLGTSHILAILLKKLIPNWDLLYLLRHSNKMS